MFALFVMLVSFAFMTLLVMMGLFSFDPNALFSGLPVLPLTIFSLFTLLILVPSIAVQVRRFHDQNLSGWFVLLGLIPYLGALVILVFMLLPGTKGPNRFGPDPKGSSAETFA